MNGSTPNGHSRPFPDSDSPTLALGHPTADELREQARLNSEAWRGALCEEAYLRREEYLGTQGLAKDSGITYWILYDTKDDGPSRRVLAGCETLKKRAVVNHNGKVQDVIAHGVGSVFTPPANRGHSYGSRMMSELSTKLQSWQAEKVPCLASILYSDIGKKFYAKFGWMPFPSAHVHLRPVAAPYTNGHSVSEATALYEEDMRQLCADDEALLRSQMEKRRSGTTVALLPDHKTIEWHHARENFLANELYKKKPLVKGAMTRVGEDRIWCIWTRVWTNEDPQDSKGNTMHILRLVVEDHKAENEGVEHSDAHIAAIAAVLRMAQREASEWHMEEVELWNPKPSTMSAAKRIDPKCTVVDRESDSITSLRWYGEPDAKVEWIENEKYGWC